MMGNAPDLRTARILKVTSLMTLTLQNAVLGLSMRYSRTRGGPMFIASTAVVMTEILKLMTSLYFVYLEHHNFNAWSQDLYRRVIANGMDTIKMSVPSLVYVVQNNLLYVSASHLDATTYQVTYQLKILTTALFSVVILKRKLLPTQWAALVLLVAGVAMAQLSGSSENPKQSNTKGPVQNKLIGFASVFVASFLSGFAAIFVEMILKSSDISIWMRNIQLSLLSLPFGLMTCFISDRDEIMQLGWFHGYDYFIAYLIVLQAAGGMIICLIIKYADNILKGFATSLAIVISGVASVFLFDLRITTLLTTGAALVIGSIILYSLPAKVDKTSLRYKNIEEI
ncbi:UDP-N-acetylglucosamine transporter [Halyomorpha halys]|uniref:UDP-N-acetylglucosamine transporter n=1 Tax=Halyomorpha halys TaxID=286706 RepID=UPI0006D524AC|nr:UDP-N-acetylglucosamine transporter-like [Halyomorpha halys]